MEDEDEEFEEGRVTVEGLATGFLQSVQIGPHHFLSDEPLEVGGTNKGATPYDLLLAALGSCTSMTVAMYARRKAWPLRNVRVELAHERVHAADCANCETKEGFVSRIDRLIELEGDLDAAQRQRLLEIAERCPVHRTLVGEIEIRSRLK